MGCSPYSGLPMVGKLSSKALYPSKLTENSFVKFVLGLSIKIYVLLPDMGFPLITVPLGLRVCPVGFSITTSL